MKTFCLATLAVGAAADCTSYSSQDTCDGDTGCSWCLSAAVPASCHSMADAKALPASIFKCDGVKDTLASMAAAVNAANTTWTAAPSSTRFGSLEEVKVLLGAYLPGDKAYVQLPEKNVTAFEAEAIPSDFSSATNWPKCGGMADVRDQSACGSCWAFGSTDSFQDRACVATGKDIRYSAEDTAFCSSAGNGCDGGNSAWNWFRSVGVVTGGDYTDKGSGKSCLPYSLAPCAHHVPATSKYPKCPAGEYPSPRCTNKCSESAYPKSKSADKMKAAQAYSVRGVSKIQTEIMTHGPLYVAFTVYADFPTYKSGVYKHKTGSALGGHAVEVMGWGVEGGEKYWLVKNSWNEQWGDNGFFKIAQGTNECGIEDSVSGGTFAAANTVEVQPTVAMSGNAATHYGDPLAGPCMSDEQNITITGVAGSVCSPAATGGKCPTDTPAGCTITPAAILQDQSGDKYCALECSPSLPIKDQKLADSICGVDNMSCKPISGVGICTYDA